jgi:hypothetical protein
MSSLFFRFLTPFHPPPWRGNCFLYQPVKLCFHVRFALCLPFSGFALRPRGHTPLEPPTAFLLTLFFFSAPAELRMLSLTIRPYVMLILISYPLIHRAQYILGVRRCRIPSQGGSGRLNLQCRSDISLYLISILAFCQFRKTSNFFRI